MYAAHFAAGLAIKSYTPSAPAWVLLTGAFLPDLLWIPFARAGLEPVRPDIFFDDWSHSLLMVIVWATIYAALFWKLGRPVALAAWISVCSHFLLDFPIHPKFLALYPHASLHLGIVASQGRFSLRNWLVEVCVTLVLGTLYVARSKKNGLAGNLCAASVVLIAGLQLLSLL